MIIAYASDLHLEFGSDTIIEKLQQLDADVLILAGDIADTPTWKAVDNINSEKGATLRLILEIASQSFTATFIVMGNHEHYKGTFQKTSKYIRNVLPDNVYLLDNSTKEVGGVVFAGTTMWTEMAAHNPVIRNQIHMGMNDFRHIRYMKGGNYAKFTPALAHQEYVKAKNFIMNLPKDKPVVMITHHSPTNYSIPVQYQTSKMNDAYYSKDMESTLEDGVFKPVLWVQGHTHNKIQTKFANIPILCNPRGYQGYESIADTFEFESEEI